MQLACDLAAKSYSEGGCPIGAVLVDDTTQSIVGKGHNCLVQESNVILHGEMSALRDAKRWKQNATPTSPSSYTMYTSLTPCFMCSGAIIQFGIKRVVIGDQTNSKMEPVKEELFKKLGIKLELLENEENIALVKKFVQEKPELWKEDWGGNY